MNDKIKSLFQQVKDAKNEYNKYFQETYPYRSEATELQCEIMLARIVALQYDLNTAVNEHNAAQNAAQTGTEPNKTGSTKRRTKSE